jgi:hypothetical protein
MTRLSSRRPSSELRPNSANGPNDVARSRPIGGARRPAEPGEVIAAMSGKPIAASSLSLIANALAGAPTVALIDRLLFANPPECDVG